jgi:hypothetical protein
MRIELSVSPPAAGLISRVRFFQLGVVEASEIALVKDLLKDFDIIVAYFGVLLPVGVDQALDPIEDRVDRFEISLDSRI